MAKVVKSITASTLIDSAEKGTQGISYETIGETLQALSVQLDEGETINSEAGRMAWRTNNLQMNTTGQGLSQMFSRMIARETIFINQYTAREGAGVVTFASEQPGKIIALELSTEKPSIVFQKGSYLCSEVTVNRSTVLVKKLSAGLLGGKGFIMQKVSGVGKAHLISDGEVVMYELKAGETMLVDQGNLIAFEESVDYGIKTVDGGAFNWLFGGEGIFHASLTGPGKVWLQTRKYALRGVRPGEAVGGRVQSGNQNPLGCIIGLVVTFGVLFLSFLFAVIGS